MALSDGEITQEMRRKARADFVNEYLLSTSIITSHVGTRENAAFYALLALSFFFGQVF